MNSVKLTSRQSLFSEVRVQVVDIQLTAINAEILSPRRNKVDVNPESMSPVSNTLAYLVD